MQHHEMLHELMELILDSDPMESDLMTLYGQMRPHIQPLADWLHVARINVRIETEPNVYEINGQEYTLDTTFHPDTGGEDDIMTLTYPKLGNTTGKALVYPWKGHVWSEEEKHHITAIAKLLVIEFSRSRMIKRLRKTPYTDPLTGLANNPGVGYYGAYIEQTCNMSEYSGCFINLKNFKYLNQHLGSLGGDTAMRQYAFRLYGFLDPKRELIARLGGDNFFALVRNEHLEEFLGMAVSLNITVDVQGRKHFLPVTAWVGVYHAKQGEKVTAILNNASFAYGQAKKSHMSVNYFEPSVMAETLRAKKVATTIPEAIRNREFVAFYQPKVHMSTGELYGCEALVRWFKDGVQIPPSDFVPVAEESGLITQLDRYMLEAVCRDLRTWLDKGIEPVPVSVNYSQMDFYSEDLIPATLEIIHKYAIPGKYLEIEITESSFLDNYHALEEFIEAMHQNGIRVSLDDFGTGYSSLNMIKHLDLDTIKLDKSFFDNLDKQNESDRVVLRSIADMFNQLHKTTISEGVETAEQINFAKEIGCDIIQGYYYDRPLSYEEFTKRLVSRRYADNGAPILATSHS